MNGKQYTTENYVKQMRSRCRVDQKAHASTCGNAQVGSPSTSSSTAVSRSGQAAALTIAEELKKKLQAYLAHKHRSDWRSGDPAEVMVHDVLALYGTERARDLAHPELVGFHMGPLLQFFGDMTCTEIGGTTCRAYTAAREAGTIGKRKVKRGTARRELETLAAALRYAHKERKLIFPIEVTFPDKAPRRERWLTRSEAAALLAGALGIVAVAYDVKTRNPVKWGRMFQPVYHVARFIYRALHRHAPRSDLAHALGCQF